MLAQPRLMDVEPTRTSSAGLSDRAVTVTAFAPHLGLTGDVAQRKGEREIEGAVVQVVRKVAQVGPAEGHLDESIACPFGVDRPAHGELGERVQQCRRRRYGD